MRKTASLLIGTCVSVLLYGCSAHTDYTLLKPEYLTDLRGQNALATVRPPLRFSQGTFSDRRPDTTVLVRFTDHGQIHNLQTTRPVDQVLFEGLSLLVKGSGHTWAAPGSESVRVDIELQDMQGRGTFWGPRGSEQSTGESSARFAVHFADGATGRAIYSGVYVAKGRRDARVGMIDNVTDSIEANIVDVLNQVGNDERLASALKK